MSTEERRTRRQYRIALGKRDFETALGIVLRNPGIFGTPPPDAPVAIQAIATDPSEPQYMMLEWSVQKNVCKKPGKACSEYTLRSSQFDHKPEGATKEELAAWFQRYVDSRTNSRSPRQLGVTLFMLEVKMVRQISDFDGRKLDD